MNYQDVIYVFSHIIVRITKSLSAFYLIRHEFYFTLQDLTSLHWHTFRKAFLPVVEMVLLIFR